MTAPQATYPAGTMAAINPTDFALFQEFLRFKQAQAQAQTQATPKVPLSINLGNAWNSLLKLPPPANGSAGIAAWIMLVATATEHPERFVRTADIHSDADGTYFSMRYTPDPAKPQRYTPFHCYGEIEGTKFLIKRVVMFAYQRPLEVFKWQPRAEADDGSVSSESAPSLLELCSPRKPTGMARFKTHSDI